MSERCRSIPIDELLIRKNNPDNFALQQTFKCIGVDYLYLLNNQWSLDKPTQRPDGTKFVFPNLSDFQAGKDVYFAWQDIKSMMNETQKPEKPERIFARILDARRKNIPLTLFIPWGVRMRGEFGTTERCVLDRIVMFTSLLKKRKIPNQVLLMPADVYATEINNAVTESDAKKYFTSVQEAAEQRQFIVKPWSLIRQENQKIYNILASQFTQEVIQQTLPKPVIYSAIEAAKKRSGYKEEQAILRSAFSYLRERMCEAEIIEKQFSPIKVSMVAKNKDNSVDMSLPRIYILDNTDQFPWLL